MMFELIADTSEKKARNITIEMMIENMISSTKFTITIKSEMSSWDHIYFWWDTSSSFFLIWSFWFLERELFHFIMSSSSPNSLTSSASPVICFHNGNEIITSYLWKVSQSLKWNPSQVSIVKTGHNSNKEFSENPSNSINIDAKSFFFGSAFK